ncbi:hypothetical protein ACFLTU_04595 [Bacteroidota bacterium]
MRGRFQRILFIVMINCLAVSSLMAEWEETPSFKERIFFGGNFGLTFGNTTSIIVSPLAGYQVTPRLSSGFGIRYEFYKSNYPGYIPFDTHIYGGSVFSRYMVIKNLSEAIGIGGLNSGLFLHGEYEILSLESKYFDYVNPNPDGRFSLHSFLVGGGLFQPIGQRAGILITVLWNLNESYNSIYSNPIIRIGFNF